jgi:hypothetical protein
MSKLFFSASMKLTDTGSSSPSGMLWHVKPLKPLETGRLPKEAPVLVRE